MKPKDWRISKKMTLQALSEKMGVAVGYLSEIERGIKEPSGRILREYHRLSKGAVSPNDFPVMEKA